MLQPMHGMMEFIMHANISDGLMKAVIYRKMKEKLEFFDSFLYDN